MSDYHCYSSKAVIRLKHSVKTKLLQIVGTLPFSVCLFGVFPPPQEKVIKYSLEERGFTHHLYLLSKDLSIWGMLHSPPQRKHAPQPFLQVCSGCIYRINLQLVTLKKLQKPLLFIIARSGSKQWGDSIKFDNRMVEYIGVFFSRVH